MIVVAEKLTEELMSKALRSIEQRGQIRDCTKSIEDGADSEQGAAAEADEPRR